jgi:hypothetical protein
MNHIRFSRLNNFPDRLLEAHDVLLLNRDILKKTNEPWSDDNIRTRTEELTRLIGQIWPVPPGHHPNVSHGKPKPPKKVDLADLIVGGYLTPGIPLFVKRKKYSHKVATLLPDGQVEVDGVAYSKPSDAATAIVGKRTGGWWFFLVDQASQRSLRSVRRDYVNAMSVDAEDDDADEDGDEDEV